jgi:hypothetical protein
MLELFLTVNLLTCSDYDFLIEGLNRANIDAATKLDLMYEFMKSTDEKCFSAEDAND